MGQRKPQRRLERGLDHRQQEDRGLHDPARCPDQPLSGYIENIRRKLEQDFSNSPVATINHLQVREYPADKRCASIHLRLELRQPAADGQRQWAEQYTLSCGSPRYADVGYELRYYHRYTDAHRDPNLQAKAEQVLGSMRIEED
ncbi:hypothetical protein VA603_02110 [Stenotrophomonas sp. MH1]|uniref:Uncharacterized protein n=1 Tax=Stenotrophomonas capsici TaxID=3110230 RepID=A0ABU5V184_9GAMM|nr:hypothetical protein [Stenotrophomonas sp. MH1]MEA5666335.1 hypothetical protein [Stenotrophomonas sp. MH1]